MSEAPRPGRQRPARAAGPALQRDPAELEHVRLRVAAGASAGDVTALGPRTATVVRVATETGAPLLAALDAAIVADQDARRAERATAIASAQGRAVARGLLVAPLLLVPLLGRLFDVDLLAYHRTPLGIVTGGLALLLLVSGSLVAHRTVAAVGRPAGVTSVGRRRAQAVGAAAVVAGVVHPVAGLVLLGVLLHRVRPSSAPADPTIADAAELTATAVAGGWSAPAALRLAADELPDLAPSLRRVAFDLEHDQTGAADAPGLDRLADVLTTATAVGAPVGPTLRRFAADVRADELARVLAAAERLPVQLTFPTALCLLPGTLLLVGAPIVAAGLGAVGA